MTKANKQAKEIADLKREVEELKAKVSPPESKFKPMSDAEWIDQMHQMREGRMSLATPPSVVRDWAVLDDNLVKGIALRDARAPTGRPGMIPSTQQVTGDRAPANVPGSGTGWAHEAAIGPSPHQRYVDAQLDAADAKDRHERMVEEARRQALLKAAERT